MLSYLYKFFYNLELKDFFGFLLKVAISIFIIFLLVVVYRGLRNDNYVLQPFGLPKKYIDAGFTGLVLANQIQDRVTDMKVKAQSIKSDSTQVEIIQTPDLNVQIMGLGLSSSSISYHLKDILGIKSKVITGELIDLDQKLKLTLRMSGANPITITESYVDGSEDALDKVISTASERVLFLTDPYRLAVLKYKNGLYDESEEIIRMIIEERSQDAKWAYLAWGNLKNKKGDTEAAIMMYERALAEDPDFSLPCRTLGWANYENGDYIAAIDYFQRSMKSAPPSFDTQNGIALAQIKLGNTTAAKESYKRNVELFPRNLWSYANYSDFLMNVTKDTAASIAIWDQAKISVDKNADYYMAVAGQYFFANKSDSALYYIDLALDYDPDNVTALQSMSNYHLNISHNYKEAEIFTKRYIKVLESNNYEISMRQNAYNQLAMNDYRLNQFDSSLIHVQKAIDLNPENPYPWSTQAEAYALMGNTEQFYISLESAMKRGFKVSNYLNENPYAKYANQSKIKKLIGKYENSNKVMD